MGRQQEETAVEELVRAVLNKGPVPRYHDQVIARHRREAPVIWAAIDRIVRETRRGE